MVDDFLIIMRILSRFLDIFNNYRIFDGYSTACRFEHVVIKIESMGKWARYILLVIAMTVLSGMGEVCSAQEVGLNNGKPERKVRTEMGIGVRGVYTGVQSMSSESVALRSRIGFGANFDFAVLFGRHFAIEAEVGYGGGSLDVANDKLERRVRTRTVDIPVLLSARLADQRVRISAGPMFTVLSSAEYTVDGEKRLFGPTYPTVNIAAGVGVRVGRHFVIEARYIHPLKESLNQYEGEEFTTQSHRITLGVALQF